MIEITPQNIADMQDRTMVLAFLTPWGRSCRTMLGVYQHINSTVIPVGRIDTSQPENQVLVRAFAVVQIPTTVVWKAGEEVARVTGLASVTALSKVISEACRGV